MQHNVCVFNNCAEEAPLNKIIYVTSSLQMDIRMKKEREGMGGGGGVGGGDCGRSDCILDNSAM